MCFGAAVLVWNFNCAGIAIQHLVRALLLLPAGHFVDDTAAVVYADAFYLEGETLVRLEQCRHRNGWGFVVRVGDHTWFDHGCIPQRALKHLPSRGAFIYCLEVAAHALAAVLLAGYLPSHLVAFVDNEAGKFALRKCGTDLAVNGILAAFWGLAASRSWSPTTR